MAEREKGIEIEILGSCQTNTTTNSTYDAKVECKHLWSYAQEAALKQVSEAGPDGCFRLITDPERRAKRIAAAYADLYFRSKEKSRGTVQFYWVALAAFVVKDIVYAFQFTRDDVFNSTLRGNEIARSVGIVSDYLGDPFVHAMRTYLALAKGNLWLFLDIYAWLWFYLEYGINPDGSLNPARLDGCLDKRDSQSYQDQTKAAIEWLPFSRKWLAQCDSKLAADVVGKEADKVYEDTYQSASMASAMAGGAGGGGAAAEYAADRVIKTKVAVAYKPFLMPDAPYWPKMRRPYTTFDTFRIEMRRVIADAAALGRLEKVARFTVTPQVKEAFGYISEGLSNKANQQKELVAIANQEQLHILQPLIYDDPLLKKTMDLNHELSRRLGGWLSPPFQVVFSAKNDSDDKDLTVRFDPPEGAWDRLTGTDKSLPNPVDRMKFVADIAKKFNARMTDNKPYMEAEIKKILGWLNA